MKKKRPIGEESKIQEHTHMPDRIVTDPLGSYTGRPADKWDVPVQDADDL